MTATDRLNQTVEMFADAPKDVRLLALLDYSKRLPELPERLADHPELFEEVPECQSPFSLIVEQADDVVHFYFRVPFEAPTVRVVGILHYIVPLPEGSRDIARRLEEIRDGGLVQVHALPAGRGGVDPRSRMVAPGEKLRPGGGAHRADEEALEARPVPGE